MLIPRELFGARAKAYRVNARSPQAYKLRRWYPLDDFRPMYEATRRVPMGRYLGNPAGPTLLGNSGVVLTDTAFYPMGGGTVPGAPNAWIWEYTLTAWLFVAAPLVTGMAFGHANSSYAHTSRHLWQIVAGPSVYFNFPGGGYGVNCPLNQWFHYAIRIRSWDYATGNAHADLDIFIDGAKVSTQLYNAGPLPVSLGDYFGIGKIAGYGPQDARANCDVKDIRYYGLWLSDERIREVARNPFDLRQYLSAPLYAKAGLAPIDLPFPATDAAWDAPVGLLDDPLELAPAITDAAWDAPGASLALPITVSPLPADSPFFVSAPGLDHPLSLAPAYADAPWTAGAVEIGETTVQPNFYDAINRLTPQSLDRERRILWGSAARLQFYRVDPATGYTAAGAAILSGWNAGRIDSVEGATVEEYRLEVAVGSVSLATLNQAGAIEIKRADGNIWKARIDRATRARKVGMVYQLRLVPTGE